MKLTVLTPERKLLESIEVSSVTLPGSEGQIEILPGHAAMAGTLETGAFGYSGTSKSDSGVISTGFFEVTGDQITVMAETLELTAEIDAARARNAQKKAEDALMDPNLDPSSFRKYQLKLQRALIRQQASSKTTH